MKKIVSVALLSVLLISTAVFPAQAGSGSDFIDCVDVRFQQLMDLSEKQSFVLGATGTAPDVGEVMFDFSEGNHTLLAIADAKCKVYAFFEHDELLGMLFRMIAVFHEIEAEMPGKRLIYRVRFSDSDMFDLDRDNIARYFSALAGEN